MVSAARKCLGAATAAVAGFIGFSYTNPSWTRRRFDSRKTLPPLCTENPSREECLTRFKAFDSPETPMDVLIVGGGSVGVGSALDAVTRGLSVGLVEMNDYASGTSSRSTKLIHGGIRYLEKAVFHLDVQQLKLVAEALRERTIMIHQAPHLCHEIPTMIPCYDPIDFIMFWCGAKLYDLIAMWERGTLKYSGFLTPYDTMKKFPQIRYANKKGELLYGSVQYYDGQMDDSRLCLSAAMTAASHGAATANYAKVEKMEIVQNTAGEKVVKSVVNDRVKQHKFTVYSRTVLNAGGPFSEEVQKLMEDKNTLSIVPSSGTHIVIEPKYCPKEGATVFPSTDGRVVFGVSWLGGCIVGTTDNKCEVTEDVRPSEADVRFLLDSMEDYVGKVPREAVLSAWSGIRPLATLNGGSENSTQNMVREHMIAVDKDRLILSVTGGKWTTYRKIAQDAVDSLWDTLLKDRIPFKPCVTEEIQLIGAHNMASVPAAAPSDIPEDVHRHWRSQYGDRYNVLLEMVRRNPAALKKLHPDEPIVEAEVIYAAQREHCERVQDFIARRTRLSFLNVDHAKAIIPEVTRVMAETKRWGRSKKNEELANAFASLDSFRAN
ncbi:putative mitochondrial glycerol-3-phosphate dehydrogenase (FAD-dependent), mitochondrial [Trypanosoma cruzi]|uniref:Glycerol-3-phosphate dehydrogenase n=1 Tax=Trypanosoma cruzi (strain CL Brener) TaxID=353153 RepID=Q4DC80_TRYCC|nr:glycerol-3-phosphate dehydrogenase, putative [Trypanosoma cruzi]EAN90136.1 glycerol-3-phosphate dehydrogenase, putative [Trypanosoma cruzi]RNC41080.1 putative mitochondrial glycerol-3-phosphate dehydrogenase (FAD-dependent), mitochondrial [Trypanosoma cruzi]|eukprot:XP_811987.1 glycerol-3-phosphate dehydrogenase [Trypanosoma cruzi strain CL Brener]